MALCVRYALDMCVRSAGSMRHGRWCAKRGKIGSLGRREKASRGSGSEASKRVVEKVRRQSQICGGGYLQRW